jgi:hypothetical protein
VYKSAAIESEAQKSEGTGLYGVAPDCPVQQDDRRLQRSTAQNPNGYADMACTGQYIVPIWWRTRLSGGAPVCPVRPLPVALVKGKCALWPFLSILVIEYQHKCFCVNLCKVVDKVQIKSKGMFLDLVHCFMD